FKVGPYSLEKMLVSNRIVSAAFFRKEDWVTCGGYSEDFVYGLEDWDLWLSIIELGREIVKIPDSYFYYRAYPGAMESRSGKRNSDRTKSINASLMVYNRHKHLYLRYPELVNRVLQFEKENHSRLKKKIKNMVFLMRYKLACLVN
ncbi:MAG: glycosyltransferase family 2 protein, partial [Methanococcaceae archaeon]